MPIYWLVGTTLLFVVWLSDISLSLALIVSAIVSGQILLASRAAVKLYQGDLVYDGSQWRRSKPVVSLLEPQSAYIPLTSIVILRFKGSFLNGPVVYLLTSKTIGADHMRQVRVLLHTNHF